MCLQNDFFDERPLDGSYAKGAPLSYPIVEANKHGASVRRGALPVPRSEQVVPVANEWMKVMDAKGGTVITTLDWHPPDHCSFCVNNGGYVPAPTFCYSGSVIANSENASLRCLDRGKR